MKENNDDRTGEIRLPELPDIGLEEQENNPKAPTNQQNPSKRREMTSEEKLEALVRAFGELEEEVKNIRIALARHIHDNQGTMIIPLTFRETEE